MAERENDSSDSSSFLHESDEISRISSASSDSESSSSGDESDQQEQDYGELGARPYMFEPEGEGNSSPSGSESDEEERDPENRLGNNNWCNCGECQAMATVPESQCCQEIDPVRQMTDDFELDIKCILHHPGFSAVCLNTWVLDTAYLQYRQQYGGRGQEATQNKKYRHTAYRQLARWCWGHLGRMVRVPLPACAVRCIRATFPSEDGVYTGYNEAALDY